MQILCLVKKLHSGLRDMVDLSAFSTAHIKAYRQLYPPQVKLCTLDKFLKCTFLRLSKKNVIRAELCYKKHHNKATFKVEGVQKYQH